MNPILIDVGFFRITWYSIFILAGVFFAGLVIIKESRKYQIDDEFITNLLFWEVIFGIIGARLYYVAFNWSYYNQNYVDIVKIWEGGLAIHGAIIAGILFALYYTHKYKWPFLKISDIVSVGLILGQAIGRWGNFFNSEAHGGEVTRAFLEKLYIPEVIINGMNINGVFYHPTFLYESLWCLLGFIVLLIIRRFYKYLKVGQLTGIYLIWYSVGRFFIEALRTDSLMIYGFKAAQLISILMFLIGLIIIIVKGRGSKFEKLYDEIYEEVEEIKDESKQSIDNTPVNI